ncbi:MAG: hypothetical protein WBE34_03560 [Candidatus Nitrosopolaris sp.]
MTSVYYHDSTMTSGKKGVFEMFLRKLPQNRSYLMGDGQEQMIQYLLRLAFNDTQFLAL